MARFEYTRTVEHYTFTPPRIVSEQDFNIIKMKIRQNPHAPLIDETSAEASHNSMGGLVLIGIVALVIALIGMFSSDTPPGWSVILMLISVFGILHPLVNTGSYESSRNYMKADQDRIAYFRTLKGMVNESPDYPTFKIRYWRIYGGF